MQDSFTEATSLLAIQIGNFNTQASIIDVVNGQYRFIGAFETRTTSGAPYYDVKIGVSAAVQQLERIVDRQLINSNGTMRMPADTKGHGFDHLVLVYSLAPESKVVIAGMINELSMESAQHLAAGIYGQVVETIGLHENRGTAKQVDDILSKEPDLILFTGGTDGGATRAVIKLAQIIQMVCQFSPVDTAPSVLFAGNKYLAARVKAGLDKYARVQIADNIRPSIESEALGPARIILEEMLLQDAKVKVNGFEELVGLASAMPMQSASGLSLLVQMIHAIKGQTRPMLGVDIGTEYASIALANQQRLMDSSLSLGMGRALNKLNIPGKTEELSPWLPPKVSLSDVKDILANKALYPQIISVDEIQIAVEQAALRVLLRTLIQSLQSRWHTQTTTFEPILLSGKPLTNRFSHGCNLMLALDGLQPTGITTIMQDPHCILPILGTAGRINPVIPIQVFDSGVIEHLATIICPVSHAPIGTPILRVKITDQDGKEDSLVVKQGALVVLPIRYNQTVRVQLQGMLGTLIDPFTRSSSATLKVTGGICGAVIDARGRPIILDKDPAARWEQIEKWRNVFE